MGVGSSVTVEKHVKRTDLIARLRSDTSQPTDQTVADLLGRLRVDDVAMSEVSAHGLRKIYERRRRRMPDAHPLAPGVDRLLAALSDYRTATLHSISIEASGRVAAVWLSELDGTVMSSVVDTDRRLHG